ncbi:MAG: azurin [Siphonobacter sp.]
MKMTRFRFFAFALVMSVFGSLTLSHSASAQTKVLILNANDAMQFDKKEFKVKAGQKIKLTLKHTGKFAKQAMGHNFVLLKKGTDLPDFASKANMAGSTDYIPKSEEGNIIAHTKLLGGGEVDTITFTAPAKGTYTYVCSFPGHYGLMQGKFIVE